MRRDKEALRNFISKKRWTETNCSRRGVSSGNISGALIIKGPSIVLLSPKFCVYVIATGDNGTRQFFIQIHIQTHFLCVASARLINSRLIKRS